MTAEGKILEGLDEQQRAAVSQTEGPVLIVAGAGSGKTRVLTGRIAYLLEKGCEPDRILALTFTKKAATEMKERISAMVGDRKARRLYMGTFHSVFIRFLREFADRLGYPSSFTIYDTGDSVSAIKSCLKEMHLDDKVYKPRMSWGASRWRRTISSPPPPTRQIPRQSSTTPMPRSRKSATYMRNMRRNARLQG